jgi:uroporphyrinogen decarboxylase
VLELPKPRPDFEGFRKVLLRQERPKRVHFVELLPDLEIVEAILSRLPGDDGADENERRWRRWLRFWHLLGYDYVTLIGGYLLPFANVEAEDTAALNRGKRTWVRESRGLIANREEFERYPWPDPGKPPDMSAFELTAKHLPEGMKIVGLTTGVFEQALWAMGLVQLSLALTEDPDLVADLFSRIGEVLVTVHKEMASCEAVGALWLGDDMGFYQATLVSPEILRRHVFPWHKKLAEIAHAAGKPFLLHSCGNLTEVMEDLISYVGIDAKHSFEDKIMPLREVKRRWGERVTILGGIDMDLLSRGTTQQVRAHVRRTLDECLPGGGYCLGSGNTVANYIPVENYLAMLDEGRRYEV